MDGDTVPVVRDGDGVVQTTLELHVRSTGGQRQVYPINRVVTEHEFRDNLRVRFSFLDGQVKFRDLTNRGLVYKDGVPVEDGLLEVGAALEVAEFRVRLWDTGQPIAYLKGYSSPYVGAIWPLGPGEHAVGRPGKRDNAIRLEHPTVSRAHATIIAPETGPYTLLAESSTNPVFLGGNELEPGARGELSHGDLLEVGKLIFRFHQPSVLGAEPENQVDIQVHSMGGLVVRVGGKVVPDTAWKTQNVKWLFALAAYGWSRPQSVESLTEKLWPEAEMKKARNNFKFTIATLRAALRSQLPESLENTKLILRSTSTLQINPDLLHSHDVVSLQRMARVAQNPAAMDEEWERAAQELILGIHGPYLEDCYAEWAQTMRHNLEMQFLELARALLERFEERQDWERIILIGSHVLEWDRLAQWVCLKVMRALREIGRGPEALRIFERSRVIWMKELGAEPQIELLREEQIILGTM